MAKGKSSAINIVFVAFIIISILYAAKSGKIEDISKASADTAETAVTLAISLVGFMALWLGLVRVLEAGGLMSSLARGLKPLMCRLFPDVPPEHPAMSNMILNISANMLGLGNAATPLGIKAMIELNKLNPFPGTATNAMCLFLALNTSSVALFPLGVIGIRTAAGATSPENIFVPTVLATLASTIVGVVAAMFLAKLDRDYSKSVLELDVTNLSLEQADASHEAGETPGGLEEDYTHLLADAGILAKLLAILCPFVFFIFLFADAAYSPKLTGFVSLVTVITPYLMPGLMLLILCYGLAKGVKVYEAVTEGGKQGFEIAIRIIPFLVAILVAIFKFSASGAMDFFVNLFNPLTTFIGMPAEVLPMAIIRPLSGGGAFGMMSEIVTQAPDSYASYVASTLQGSTETTFYVLAVYFGSVGIIRVRHALIAGLLADFAGIVTACVVCRFFWQG